MFSVLRDFRFALRVLRKSTGFTVIVALTLALGIGATSAVLSLVHGVLLTPPPYPKPGQIVLITPHGMDGRPYAGGSKTGQWTEWQKEAKSFEALAGYDWTFDFLILPDGSEPVEGIEVTAEYFKVIGITPAFGRAFLPTEVSAQPDHVIILGFDLWQRRFHGDTNVIGQTVRISRHEQPLTIVGVMPPGVRFLPSIGEDVNPNYDVNARVDYWLPAWLDVTKPKSDARAGLWSVAGRLRDGVSVAQAQAELRAISAGQAQADRDYEGVTARLEPLNEFLNRDGRKLLLPLLGAVAFVFLIACGNVAGLLLARGLQRQQEYAVRCALGAGRLQLLRQVLTESLLLAIIGGAVGTGLALATVKVFKATSSFVIPRLDAVIIGWPVLMFCMALVALAASLAGLVPAVRASQMNPVQGMKSTSPTSTGARKERLLLKAVAIIQSALTLALLVGAGLLIRTVSNLAKVRPGYDTENILTLSVMTDWDNKTYDFHVQALARISALPGVKKAAFVWGLPLTGNKFDNDPSVSIEGEPEPTRPADKLTANARAVSPDYFDALGIKIAAGRGFRATDNWEGWKNLREPAPGESPFVCIINQAMAEKCFPNANPIGRKLRCHPAPKRLKEIIGVVANTRTDALNKNVEPEIYLPFFQAPVFTKHLIVRTTTDPRSLMRPTPDELSQRPGTGIK